MILFVGQRLGRADNDRIAGMDSDRIEVFHVTDGDCGIVCITHYLIFDLLKAFDALFDQDLMHR